MIDDIIYNILLLSEIKDAINMTLINKHFNHFNIYHIIAKKIMKLNNNIQYLDDYTIVKYDFIPKRCYRITPAYSMSIYLTRREFFEWLSRELKETRFKVLSIRNKQFKIDTANLIQL